MKLKNIFSLALTVVIAAALSLPAMAKESNEREVIANIISEDVYHNNLMNIVLKTNEIEKKCDAIQTNLNTLPLTDTALQELEENLAAITIEEFYSERACIEIIPSLLNNTMNGTNMTKAVQLFINKFKHPDNLMISYARAFGSMYRMTLLANWANYEYLSKDNFRSLVTSFANFLITNGADINEVSEFSTWDKTSVTNYVYAHGSNSAKDLIRRTEKRNQISKRTEERETIHKTILNTLKETDRIVSQCDEILRSIEKMDARAVAAELSEISVEDFYSERHCLDNIHVLLEQARNGKDMKRITKKFIKKFGHPDNLIVSKKTSEGNYHIMTLLADWMTSTPEQIAAAIPFGEFLIEKGASQNQKVIDASNNVVKTVSRRH